jgi:replicative DNA helicase
MPDAGARALASLEAEQCVLGGLLLDNGAWDRVADLLTAEDFARPDHAVIYRHIGRLLGAGKPADIVTVDESIENSPDRGRAGGLTYLGTLAQNTPSTHNARRYAEIVRDWSHRRGLHGALQEAIERCHAPEGVDAAALASEVENALLRLVDARDPDLTRLGDAAAAALRRVDEAREKGGLLGLSTGLVDLDRMTGGAEPGDLVVVGARASMGKSSFAQGVAEHVAATAGPVLIFSLEMSDVMIGMRALADRARLAVPALRSGHVPEEGWGRLVDAVAALAELPVYIDDTPAIRPAQILARARRLQRRHGLRLVVVDYLTLMAGIGDTRDERVGGLAVELKAIAKRLNVPVLALAQLNRGLEDRPNKRPILSDLRESGVIEQAADLVLMLYREEVYDPSTPRRGIAELIIEKQRNGPTGTVYATWLPERMRFENFVGELPALEPQVVQRGFQPGSRRMSSHVTHE